ncbi:MAG TPA: tripartite tricarboxylate transporter permease [Desulfuromonadales bacterium]|nr:tripartite tricarboxylate transporter permease [Desulfuromonadales bacterium]
MGTFGHLLQGFSVALLPVNLALALAGGFIGTMMGALPGLGPINGVVILLPIAYAAGLPADSTLILLMAVYMGAEFGGRVSSILLNVPGDAGAVITTLDGHPLAKKGLAGPALALSGISSFIGGMLSIVGLTFFGPLLAKLAISFGPAEYFVLMVFAFATLTSMMGSSPAKSLIGTCLGLMLAVVGVDSTTGVLRYTFGEPELYDGVEFLTVVVGLFAISEVLLLLEHSHAGGVKITKVGRVMVSWKELMLCKWTILRSTVIGFIVGVLPGTGASVASAISYSTEKRLVDREGTFGKGDFRGLAAPEAANNASVGGAMVPMLTLGIPGSGTTAVLLGALMLFNINPGPLLFEQQPALVWGVIASMYIATAALLVMNLPMVKIFTKVLQLPDWILIPGIVVLSVLGVFSVNGSTFSLLVMIGLGVFAYILRTLNYPMAPVVLGFVLGELMEDSLRRALSISGGEIGILFASPIVKILWVLSLLVVFAPLFLNKLVAGQIPAPADVPADAAVVAAGEAE